MQSDESGSIPVLTIAAVRISLEQGKATALFVSPSSGIQMWWFVIVYVRYEEVHCDAIISSIRFLSLSKRSHWC